MKDLWFWFARADCFPDCDCEQMLAQCLICQPSAFWSSWAYALVAILLYFQVKTKTPEVWFWLSGLLIVTVSSLLAHASFTNFFLAVDMAAIINLLGFLHLPKVTRSSRVLFQVGKFILTFAASVTLLFFLPLAWWVPLTGLAFFGAAAHLFAKHSFSLHKDRFFMASMVIFGLSFSLFIFDKNPMLCQVTWLPYGHSLWHLGSAVTAYMFGRWYFISMPKKLNF